MKYKDIILNHINIEKMREELERLDFKEKTRSKLWLNFLI